MRDADYDKMRHFVETLWFEFGPDDTYSRPEKVQIWRAWLADIYTEARRSVFNGPSTHYMIDTLRGHCE